jgi:hypothetical protein
MFQAYRKYGWECSIEESGIDPFKALESMFPAPSGGAYGSGIPWFPIQSSSGVPWYVIGSSGFPAFPSATASASDVYYPSGPASSAPALPSGVGGPSSGFPVPSGQPSSSGFISIPASSAPWPSSNVPTIPSSAPASQPEPSGSAPASAPAPEPSSSGSPSGGGSGEGEVSAEPVENDASYLAPVTIGGNQKLNLNFDTGSADLWVFSTEMPSSQSQGHSVFDPSKSSTFQDYQGGSWEIQYGDGSTAEGTVGFDTVEIGGIVAQKQAVELAQTVSKSFLTFVDSDGLLGLGFSSINTIQPQQQKTWFENVMDDLEQPLFTADLEEDAAGTYEFGTIDSSKYSGEIHYTPIDVSGGWYEFESPTFTIGGQQQSCSTCSPAIADTGTSLLIWDDDVVEAYYSQVEGAQYDSQNQGYIYPCSSSLPDLGIAIGQDYTATIKGADMEYARDGGGVCFGGIQSNGGNPINIVGDVLLKQFFAVFDAGNQRFGIAEKA